MDCGNENPSPHVADNQQTDNTILEPVVGDAEMNTLSVIPESQVDSESLLANMSQMSHLFEEPSRVNDDTTVQQDPVVPVPPESQSQSLLNEIEKEQSQNNLTVAANDSEDMFKSYDETRIDILEKSSTATETTVDKTVDVMSDSSHNNQNTVESEGIEEDSLNKDDSENPMDVDEIEGAEGTDDDVEDENEDVEQDEDENDDENEKKTNIPIGKIKKIMKICLQTNDPDDVAAAAAELEKSKSKKKKGKGAKVTKIPSSNNNLLLTKEAVYLTTAVTEMFIAAITQQSSRITTATKKKTMTVEHLKRALSDSDVYEFLQGCFQPSLIIGD